MCDFSIEAEEAQVIQFQRSVAEQKQELHSVSQTVITPAVKTVILILQCHCSLEPDPTPFDPLTPSKLLCQFDMVMYITVGGLAVCVTCTLTVLIKTQCSPDISHIFPPFKIK